MADAIGLGGVRRSSDCWLFVLWGDEIPGVHSVGTGSRHHRCFDLGRFRRSVRPAGVPGHAFPTAPGQTLVLVVSVALADLAIRSRARAKYQVAGKADTG